MKTHRLAAVALGHGLIIAVTCMTGSAKAQETVRRLHAVSLHGVVAPLSFDDEQDGWSVKGGYDVGATGAYEYFLRDWFSLGARATVRGTFADRSMYQTGSLSHTTVAIPFVVAFEPRLSSRARFVAALGVAYQHVWAGPSRREADYWIANGYEGLLDLGVAVRLAGSRLELVALLEHASGTPDMPGKTRTRRTGSRPCRFRSASASATPFERSLLPAAIADSWSKLAAKSDSGPKLKTDFTQESA